MQRMNTFIYIDKRLVELDKERKTKLEYASSDSEKAQINAFYEGAKSELDKLRDRLMSDVQAVSDELPEKHIINYAELN